MSQDREDLIARLQKEQERLQNSFRESILEKDSARMKDVDRRLSHIEEQLRLLENSGDNRDSLSPAKMLMAELESSMSSTSIPALKAELYEDRTVDASLSKARSLLEEETFTANSRSSLLEAFERAQERSVNRAAKTGELDKELDSVFSFKALAENTVSVFDLFFRPSKFIDNQLNKQNKPSPPKPDVQPAKQESPAFSAAPSDENDEARKELAAKLAKYSFYDILSLDESATAEAVAEAYNKKVKNLRSKYEKQKNIPDWQILLFVEALSKARDVLSDAKLRRDYDLSMLGLHDFDLKQPKEDARTAKTCLSRIELLSLANLIDEREARIALGDAKGNDAEAVQNLLDKGTITYQQQSAVELAHSLIEQGKISLGQFKIAFGEMREGLPFLDTLLVEGWVTMDYIIQNKVNRMK